MDNPETPETLGTQDTGRRQSRDTSNIGEKKQTNKQTNKKTQERKQNKNKQHEPHQKPAVNPCTRDKTQPMYFHQNVKLEVKET